MTTIDRATRSSSPVPAASSADGSSAISRRAASPACARSTSSRSTSGTRCSRGRQPGRDLRSLDACRGSRSRTCAHVYNLACDMGGMGFIEANKAACMLSVLINTHLLMAGKDEGISGISSPRRHASTTSRSSRTPR